MTHIFTAHNIVLDNGEHTKPEALYSMDKAPNFLSARRILNLVFPLNKEAFRIVDLGCLEGGYAVEFARMGFNTLGIELRDINYECCQYVKSKTNLPNLSFVQDDVLNIEQHGIFDAAFCCGILYHLDKPKAFLEKLAKQTRKLIIIQTHFSLANEFITPNFKLSPIEMNEGLKGRWYKEFAADETAESRQLMRWSSFENSRSFWIQREELIDQIYRLGFTTVFEQFDSLAPDISGALQGDYLAQLRGTFVGIRNM